jgi:hypothetical protein
MSHREPEKAEIRLAEVREDGPGGYDGEQWRLYRIFLILYV